MVKDDEHTHTWKPASHSRQLRTSGQNMIKYLSYITEHETTQKESPSVRRKRRIQKRVEVVLCLSKAVNRARCGGPACNRLISDAKARGSSQVQRAWDTE